MYKVRFNLGRGSNYRKWQIRDVNNKPKHYDPSKVTLVMSGCKLKNNKKTAEKIFSGENKTVCAWIECDDVEISYKDPMVCTKDTELSYNPRVNPFWTMNGENFDNTMHDLIYSNGTKLFLPENKYQKNEHFSSECLVG
jgi:hypothetical protein